MDVHSAELSLHGFLRSDGELQRGRVVVQSVKSGSWRGASPWRSEGEDGLASEAEGIALLDSVADQLHGLGYVGPFGVDGLRWTDESGSVQVGWGSDVNARYTMSMGAGFDAVPVELVDA